VKSAYPRVSRLAKLDGAQFQRDLEALCHARAGQLLQAYLDAEVDDLLARARYQRREPGQPPAHRDGYDRERQVFSNRGPIALRRPRVRGIAHESVVLPKFRRRLENVDATLTEGWIRGLSQRDCEPTLRALLGAKAPLSASTVARVNARLHQEYLAWKRRRLDDLEVVYVWADGIHLGSGPDDERRVFLIVIGADRMGHKHLLALEEALSESEQSWSDLFADLRQRGMNAPALLVADGAHGLWAAADKLLAGTAQQRCWKHKITNVLDKLPKKHHADALAALREIMYAEHEPHARRRLEDVVREARGDVKAHSPSCHGTVARLDTEDGFGFIQTEDGRELYFTRESVVHPLFEHLLEGTEVQFIEEPAGEGVQAKRVSAGKHGFRD